MPLLTDWRNEVMRQVDPEAREIALVADSNRVVPVPVVLGYFQGIDVVGAVGGDFDDFPARLC